MPIFRWQLSATPPRAQLTLAPHRAHGTQSIASSRPQQLRMFLFAPILYSQPSAPSRPLVDAKIVCLGVLNHHVRVWKNKPRRSGRKLSVFMKNKTELPFDWPNGIVPLALLCLRLKGTNYGASTQRQISRPLGLVSENKQILPDAIVCSLRPSDFSKSPSAQFD